jgi:hypothetical protein
VPHGTTTPGFGARLPGAAMQLCDPRRRGRVPGRSGRYPRRDGDDRPAGAAIRARRVAAQRVSGQNGAQVRPADDHDPAGSSRRSVPIRRPQIASARGRPRRALHDLRAAGCMCSRPVPVVMAVCELGVFPCRARADHPFGRARWPSTSGLSGDALGGYFARRPRRCLASVRDSPTNPALSPPSVRCEYSRCTPGPLGGLSSAAPRREPGRMADYGPAAGASAGRGKDRAPDIVTRATAANWPEAS